MEQHEDSAVPDAVQHENSGPSGGVFPDTVGKISTLQLRQSHTLSDLMSKSILPVNAPLHRWTARNSFDRQTLCDLDDAQMPRLSVGRAWVCSHAIALLLAVPMSLTFLLVAGFPPDGYRPQTTPVWHNVACALGYAIAHFGAGHWLAFFDPMLSTCRWFAYYLTWNLIFCFALRVVVERSTDLPCWVYIGFLLFPYPVVDNPWFAAVARVTGDPKWHNPYFWMCNGIPKLLFTALKHEFMYFMLTITGVLMPMAFVLLDYVLLTPVLPTIFRTYVFPFVGYCSVRVAYSLSSMGIEQTVCPWVKLHCYIPIYLSLAGLKIRLVSQAGGWHAMSIVLAYDWLFFTWSVGNYWMCTSPRRASFSRALKLYLHLVSFEKAAPPPELRTADYRSYEMLVKQMSLLSAHYMGVLGYLWLSVVLRLPAGSPAVSFWFPGQWSSCLQLCAGLGSASCQALILHAVVSRASRRFRPACHFSGVFPGWLRHPLWPVKAALVVAFVPPFLTQLAFAFDQIDNDHP